MFIAAAQYHTDGLSIRMTLHSNDYGHYLISDTHPELNRCEFSPDRKEAFSQFIDLFYSCVEMIKEKERGGQQCLTF